jgi:RHS repeat-associated protein
MARFATMFAVCCLICAPSFAQNPDPDPAAGIQPWSTQAADSFSSVDLATGTIFVNIPVRSKTGKIPFSYDLVMTSNVYSVSFTGCEHQWVVSPSPIVACGTIVSTSMHYAGIQGGTPFSVSVGFASTYTHTICDGVSYATTLANKFSVIDSTGTGHPIAPGYSLIVAGAGMPASCYNITSINQITTDGSGYTLIVTVDPATSGYTATVYDKSGNELSGSTVVIKDPDNAEITQPSPGVYDDTLGEQVLQASPTFASSGQPSTGTYQYTDVNGNPQTFQTNYLTYTEQTAFGCSGLLEVKPTQIALLNSITTPTGTFSFSYETTPGDTHTPHYVTGRLASITYPSGGSVAYAYSGGSGNTGISCGNAVVPTLTKTVSDTNGNVSKWSYVNSIANGTVTETDPAKNQTVHSFEAEYQTQAMTYQGGCPTSITGCNGGGTLLRTVTTCYNNNFTNCGTSGPTLPITQTDIFTSYNGRASNLVETKFDSYENVVEVKQYDFVFSAVGSPAGQTPLSDTLNYYGQAWNGTSCAAYSSGAYIYNTPCYSVTDDSAGAPVAQTQITYTSTGHPATTKKWNGSTWLTSSATYTGTGTVATSHDVNGALYTYAYTGTDGCSNSVLPTSVTVTGTGLPSAGLATSTQWNCSGAAATQTSDPNKQATGYTYTDPLWRLTSMTDPLLNATNYSYPSPTTFDTKMSFPSQSNKVLTTDGLGRIIESQTRTAPGATTFDNTILYSYGWNTIGAVTTQTLPGGTAVTTTQYDAVGRPISITDAGGGTVSYTYVQNDVMQSVGPSPTFQKQLQYDGLGRLTRVCEITSVSGSGSCGQTNPATGFLTTYGYTYNASGNLIVTVTQNAQPGAIGGAQTRKYTYDGLNRLLSETNPEWGPGTATYTYDVACGTLAASAGDLTTKVDNAGNTSCYGYDALHRVTDVMVYEAGACYPPVKRFRYDSTANAILPVPSGYPTGTSSNTSGRMVEAWTGDCVWPTPANGYDSATDEWFAYSARGEMSDLWESTAHIDGYYHGTATYAANGALASVGGVPGYTSVTYGVDTEGRLSTATQGTTDLVTSVAYTPGSQLHTISLGNGDQDSYLYDTNTGRMTNYTFTVNGATDSGALTWNSNWTLAQLGITDDVNSGGSQTCTYSGYDNLGRLGSVTCGSAWSQTFSYDPFGNITKSGSSAWAPGYNEATNQASPPITYDNNGNMTNDTLRTYAYYVDNKLGSINSTTCNIFGSTDGTCILYDAFGREVERGVNGAYNEVMYTPVGKTAIMNGETTTVNAYFPLPGGATYYQSGSAGGSQYFWHKDWQGSARLSSSITNRTAYFDRAFAPFGESYGNIGNTAGLDFTGDTQDSFAGLLYDTPGRELHPGQGRWLSPDPSGLGAVDPTKPQSWNRYGYVGNNPLSYTDPSGLSYEGHLTCQALAVSNAGTPCDTRSDMAGWNQFELLQLEFSPSPTYGWIYGWHLSAVPLNVHPVYLPDSYMTFGFSDLGFYWGAVTNPNNGLLLPNLPAVSIGPCAMTACVTAVPPPPPPPPAVIRATLPTWQRVGAQISCIGGLSPDLMGPPPSAAPPQDSTDSTVQTEGQQQLYGPNKSGQIVVYNSGSQVPSLVVGGTTYGTQAVDCSTRVPE